MPSTKHVQELITEEILTFNPVGDDGELSGTGCAFCDAFEEERAVISHNLFLADRLLSVLTPPDDDSQELILAIRNRIHDALVAYRTLAGL